MKGSKRPSKGLSQTDVPVVFDPCNVDVNDPVGNHVVNFSLQIEATEDKNKPFEGDVDISFPHALPKSAKPPKIEIGHPQTNWTTQLQVNIDDAFINGIKDKRMMYKIVFLYKTSATHGKAPPRTANKKGNDKSAPHVTNHTFFIDASCLLVRGGRFKPFLSYTASCVPPSFTNFTFTVTIDHPLLSDAQIRRHQPTACFLKAVHQLPDKPISFEELAATCVGPFISFKSSTLQAPYLTSPATHGTDMKLDIAVMFWQTPTAEISVELHDRDNENPEQNNIIGSAFVIPDPTVKPTKIEALSIDAILGVKKETVSPRPYGALSFALETGRYMIPFRPVQSRDSVITAGSFNSCGTYLTVEVEAMKDTIPIINVTTAIPTGKGKNQQERPHSTKEDKTPQKPVYFLQRIAIIARGNLTKQEKKFIFDIQTNIVKFNAEAFGQKDIACVPSMKIEKEECGAISGFIIMTGGFELTILELLVNSPSYQGIYKLIESAPGGNIQVFYNQSLNYNSPRLYGAFDCAVKKYKLQVPLSELLLDPLLFVQNSHLSNCFEIADKLKRIDTAKSFDDFENEKMWPSKPELEMLNAKKGCLLSLAELAFPPRTEESQEESKVVSRNQSALSANDDKEIDFTYVPLKKNVEETCNRDYDFYVKRNLDTIRKLEETRRVDHSIITRSDDGETIICKKGAPIPEGYIADDPEPYNSLAEFSNGPKYQKLFREENGKEIRGGNKFYHYKSPKTVFGDINDIKVDQNHDAWEHGDKPLCAASDRFFNSIRGEFSSDFHNVMKDGDYFDPNPGNVHDIYNDKKVDQPIFLTKSINHKERFVPVVVPAEKNEEILARAIPPPSLQISERFVSHEERERNQLKQESMERSNKQRFNPLFKAPLKKGTTDSAYVAKIVPTFPTAKPSF